nr:peptidylprolyl isomerase [Motiliproteus sp. SC1-56]
MSLSLSPALKAADKPASADSPANPRVALHTSKGDIILELYPQKAPATVKNFLDYVENGFYDGLIFHRVISNFMIQGGGFTEDMTRKATNAPIKNEADNGLANEVGTVAMARTSDPHSASSQFFINTKYNEFLNFQSQTPRGWGYAVFGKVVEGMDVVRAIEATPTTVRAGFRDVPQTPVVIQTAEQVE